MIAWYWIPVLLAVGAWLELRFGRYAVRLLGRSTSAYGDDVLKRLDDVALMTLWERADREITVRSQKLGTRKNVE